MSNFDEFDAGFAARLKQEMQRVPAPAGFTDRVAKRVMAQVAARQQKVRLAVMPKRVAWSTRWMALAAMLLVAVLLGSWQWRQHEVRREREQAKLVQRQFDMAMQVTQKTLTEVQLRVGRTVRDTVRQ